MPQSDIAFEDLQDPCGKAYWPGDKGRDGCRTPMPWMSAAAHGGFSAAKPWLPSDAAHRAQAVDVQEADPASTLQLTRRVLALRRAHPALRLGRFETLYASDTVLVLRREHGTDAVLAAFNLGADAAAPVTAEPPPPGCAAPLYINGAERKGAHLHLPPGAALIEPTSASWTHPSGP